MASKRKIVFTNEYWYHVCNRGIEGRNIFLSHRDYSRFLSIMDYYKYQDVPIRFSYFDQLSSYEQEQQLVIMEKLQNRVSLGTYCLMPNHFHFLLRQNTDNGISSFISDVTNSYSKYFNTKNERIGTLFQGVFKAVFIESEEHLLHVSRYIHINPFVASLCSFNEIFTYPWSSLSSYMWGNDLIYTEKDSILSHFQSKESFQTFIENHMFYAKERKDYEHLYLED